MSISTMKPVYIRDKDIQMNKAKPISDYRLACSVRMCIQDIQCVQKDRQLWRIYVCSRESRDKLLTEGVDIDDNHIEVFDTNPFSAGVNSPQDKVLRVTVKGIPLSVDDECILYMLKKYDFVQPTSDIKYEKIRDPDTRKMTDIMNGNRFIYIKALDEGKYLPRSTICAGMKCQIYHFGQPSQKRQPLCTTCWSTDHFRSTCTKEPCCRVCRQKDHQPGSDLCKFYETLNPENYIKTNGKGNVLSNFYMHDLVAYGTCYKSSEHAFQHTKALRCGDLVRAEVIKESSDPLSAKRVGDQVSVNEQWRSSQLDVMREIIELKYDQVKQFRKAIQKAPESSVFVEATKDGFWASGLDGDATMKTKADKWPGENRMGSLLKELARKHSKPQSTQSTGVSEKGDKDDKGPVGEKGTQEKRRTRKGKSVRTRQREIDVMLRSRTGDVTRGQTDQCTEQSDHCDDDSDSNSDR